MDTTQACVVWKLISVQGNFILRDVLSNLSRPSWRNIDDFIFNSTAQKYC